MSPRAKKPRATAQQALPLREPGQPTLGEVIGWFRRAHLPSGDLGRSTVNGYKSTFRQALAHFGEGAVPAVGEARAWLDRRRVAGEIGNLTANSHRDRLHAVYSLFREQQRGVTLNPWTFRRFKEDTRHIRGAFANLAELWPRLLAAMPDDRARAFLSLNMRLGWRLGEVLALEWPHLMRAVGGGHVLRKQQQRASWQNIPQGLKHDGLVGTYALHPETVQYLRAARRAQEEGRVQLGCARGVLVGQQPCGDGVVRSYLFPYREEHTVELIRRMREVAPEEFPRKQAFHRLRRAFLTHVVKAFGVEEANRLAGHKHISTTQLYCREVLGVQATGEDMAKLYAAQDSMLSDAGRSSDNAFEAEGQ